MDSNAFTHHTWTDRLQVFVWSQILQINLCFFLFLQNDKVILLLFVYNAFPYGMVNLSSLKWCFIFLPYKNLPTLPSVGRMRIFNIIFYFRYFSKICLCKQSLHWTFLLNSKERRKADAFILTFIDDEICEWMTDSFFLPQFKVKTQHQ